MNGLALIWKRHQNWSCIKGLKQPGTRRLVDFTIKEKTRYYYEYQLQQSNDLWCYWEGNSHIESTIPTDGTVLQSLHTWHARYIASTTTKWYSRLHRTNIKRASQIRYARRLMETNANCSHRVITLSIPYIVLFVCIDHPSTSCIRGNG